MDRLAAVPLRRTLLGAENQVVVLEESFEARVPVEHESWRRADEVRGQAREVLAHRRQRTRWRGSLRLAVEVLVQDCHRIRDAIEICGFSGLEVGGSDVGEGQLPAQEIDDLVADLAAGPGVPEEKGVDRRRLLSAVAIKADRMGLHLAELRLAFGEAQGGG